MSWRRTSALVVLALMTLVSACVRPVRERLILLSSATAPTAPSPDAVATISLARVSVPEYLDGYDVVSRISPHELQRDDGSRWAERLPEAAARVLRAGLAANGVRAVEGASNVVSVDIAAFEATADGVVVLSATWEVFDEDGQPLGRGAGMTEQAAGAGAPAQAAAMERALQSLAADIAETIKSLPGVGVSVRD